MKTSINRILSFTTFLILAFAAVSSAQVTSTTSNNGTMTPQVARAQDSVNNVLLESGTAFREGLLAYVDDNRQMAGEKFNKSIEVFLYSTLNIQKDAKLQGCYNQLIETIYRIEFPADNQMPKVRELAATCTWNIETSLSDTVARITRPSQNRSAADISMITAAVAGSNAGGPKVGFNNQEFEPSPLDELSKLVLTSDEL